MKFNKDLKTDDIQLPQLGLLEIGLIQVFLYSLLWVWNSYAATLVSVVFVAVFIFILAFALAAELVERSKVPKWYFKLLVLSIIIPVVLGLLFTLVIGADFSWMEGI